jgi:hypothetical protein
MPRTSSEEEERPSGHLNGEYTLRSSRRTLRKSPQPWFVLKFTILVASAIIAYTAYVYIGRFCIPMIKRRHSSSSSSDDLLGSRTMGSEWWLTPPFSFIHTHKPLLQTHLDAFFVNADCVFLFVQVAFLAVFAVSGLMVIWAYVKVRLRASIHPILSHRLSVFCVVLLYVSLFA